MISSFLNFINKKKNFPFYFITPIPYAIGTASESILIAASKAKKEKKSLIILYTNFFAKKLKYFICNKALFNNLVFKNNSKKINYLFKFFIRFFLEIEFFFQRLLVIINDYFCVFNLKEEKRFLNIGLSEIYENKKINNFHIANNYKKIPKIYINNKIIDIENKVKKKCKLILNQVGFDEKKIVCIHVRDNLYRKDKDRKEYRNSDINNYIETIKYLINKNYQVVRIGNSLSKEIKFNDKFFFDYSKSDIQSEEMDLYLIKKCNFYIGTQSGPLDVAYMFNKPVLTTNMVELYNGFPRKLSDRGIFKKIYYKSGKKISLKSFFGFSYNKYHVPHKEIKDIIFQENTSSEILESVIEFEKNLKKNKKTLLQKKFDKQLNHSLENLININIKSKKILEYNYNFIRQTRMFKSCQGTLCHSYLKKNF